MDYTELLGHYVDSPKDTFEEVHLNAPKNKTTRDSEYIRPRLGIPEGFISWEENKEDIQKILDKFIKTGKRKVPKNINRELRQHAEHFRNILDMYDIVVQKKIFEVDEIWFRCFSEGPDFSSFIKKSRAYSLQAKISLTSADIKEEYVFDNYSGYDCIIHERYLIYWLEEPVDWVWSLLEPGDAHEDEFARIAHRFLARRNLIKLYDQTINVIEPVAGRVSSLNSRDGKTTALKNTWTPDITLGDWQAVRKVVPTRSHQTRDTGVPDVQSLCKLKLIHKVAREISENIPYSANCSFERLNKRVERIRGGRCFIHLDFKKYGLTFHRGPVRKLLEILNLGHLAIDNFYLLVDGENVETSRGGVLGWFDPLVAIVVSIILHDFKERLGRDDFDFIVFNDDVEISLRETDQNVIETIKQDIVDRLEYFGFIISHRKTYASKMFIFLEQYEYPGYLDMSKKQLVVNHFAKSLSTPFTWEAKTCFADGYKNYKHWKIREIAFNSIECVIGEIEYEKPVELGGWIHSRSGRLNTALVDADPGELSFFVKMGKWKRPPMTERMVTINLETLENRKQRLIMSARKGYPEEIRDLEYDSKFKFQASEREAVELQISHDSQGIIMSAEYDDSATEGIPDG
jgi:hypothetical protein